VQPENHTENNVKNSASRTRGLKPFPKGKSGNPGGRPKKAPITEELQKYFSDPRNARNAALAVIAQFKKGNPAAIANIFNRVDGVLTDKHEVKSDGPTVVSFQNYSLDTSPYIPPGDPASPTPRPNDGGEQQSPIQDDKSGAQVG
jgi:hypothetical protein